MIDLGGTITKDDLKMTDREYEIAMAITYLMNVADKLGIKDETELSGTVQNSDHVNKIIIRFAAEVYKTWAALFPWEKDEFIENTKYELDVERPVKASIKAGGISPIAFPIKLDGLYHTLMPKVKTQDKRFWQPLLRYIPELKRSNYV